MNASTQKRGWELYQFPPSFVLGFHGCDAAVGEAILRGHSNHLRPNKNDYDWLGTGIYFWESNSQRAFEFAKESSTGARHSRGNIKTPFVLGAVLNLGQCLDLRDRYAQSEVTTAYDALIGIWPPALRLPTNGPSLKLINLDCAVINYLHELRERNPNISAPYDTVRASYREGQPLYPGTDLCHQDHIQICVRNTDSILGYFRPIFR